MPEALPKTDSETKSVVIIHSKGMKFLLKTGFVTALN